MSWRTPVTWRARAALLMAPYPPIGADPGTIPRLRADARSKGRSVRSPGLPLAGCILMRDRRQHEACALAAEGASGMVLEKRV